MFSHLMASSKHRPHVWTGGSATMSLLLHSVLVVGATFATTAGPAIAREVQEEVTFLEVKEKTVAPEPEKAPPPPPPAVANTPPPPKGFQELVPPSEPPPVIPEVDTSAPAVSAADFSGVGVAGGTATGVEVGGTPQNTAEANPAEEEPGFAYEVAVLERVPVLTNAAQAQRILERTYPKLLLDAGIQGVVVMRFVVEPDGKVDASSVQVISTTHELFSDASVNVVEKLRFKPGIYKGQPVRVLIQIPVEWKPAQQ